MVYHLECIFYSIGNGKNISKSSYNCQKGLNWFILEIYSTNVIYKTLKRIVIISLGVVYFEKCSEIGFFFKIDSKYPQIYVEKI